MNSLSVEINRMSNDEDRIHSISDRFKEERKRLGLSQEKASKALGASISSLYMYEKGKVSPPASVLFLLALLGADIQYIVTGERSSVNLPDTEQKLISAFRAAPEPVQAGILAMLQVVPVADAPTSEKSPDVNPKFTGKVGQVIEGNVKVKGKQTFKF
ncbi:helix-turn-helix domain-containing protein [Iodobacter sp. BJB302]|uniref:helix-turn-helix domain-containing protein n=1 Tax=Iodobacter sp. BJB302 TaxID=1506510 RepID=UPI000C0F453A|nr:helix-turn-helix transcriptional regulator [Iodobacter sp. BJB302]PHV01641.1 transcriptional regulator [Iodobacter sp. BJB302]